MSPRITSTLWFTVDSLRVTSVVYLRVTSVVYPLVTTGVYPLCVTFFVYPLRATFADVSL